MTSTGGSALHRGGSRKSAVVLAFRSSSRSNAPRHLPWKPPSTTLGCRGGSRGPTASPVLPRAAVVAAGASARHRLSSPADYMAALRSTPTLVAHRLPRRDLPPPLLQGVDIPQIGGPQIRRRRNPRGAGCESEASTAGSALHIAVPAPPSSTSPPVGSAPPGGCELGSLRLGCPALLALPSRTRLLLHLVAALN